ncbi:MAG: ArnT family glycosyltransferase [Candidatus Sumerlaeia bacterium]
MSFWQPFRLGIEELRSRWKNWLDEKSEERILRQKAKERPWGLYVCVLLMLLVAILYAVLRISEISTAHVDLGDGNYLYTAGRIADGLTIYEDFLSPQPPMHPITGSVVIRLGRWIESRMANAALLEVPPPLVAVRIYTLLIRLGAAFFVFLIARRVSQSMVGGVLAFAIFLFLPIGYYWSQGYQSENLEILFLMVALYLFLRLRPVSMVFAGLLMALAVLTNMTAAPYALALLVYLAVRHAGQGGREGRILTLCYVLPLALMWGIVAMGLEWSTDAFFRNTITNQVTSYPEEGFWGYGFPKLLSQSLNVLSLEAGIIALCLLGISLYNRMDTRQEREFLVWYALVLLLSIVFVTKGGTMDYIFTIGEPVVAIFAAYYLVHFFYPATLKRFFRKNVFQDTSIVPQVAFFLILVFVIGWPGIRFNMTVHSLDQTEQKPDGAQRLVYMIEQRSEADEPVLAPPYYAFLANRKLYEEYAELFLWTTKYWQERKAGTVGEGVLKVRSIQKALINRQIPVVVANSGGNLLLSSPEVRQAIEQFYKPLLKPDQIMQTRNARYQVYVPKTDAEMEGKDDEDKKSPGPKVDFIWPEDSRQ